MFMQTLEARAFRSQIFGEAPMKAKRLEVTFSTVFRPSLQVWKARLVPATYRPSRKQER